MKKGHITLSLQVCNDLVLNRKTSNLFYIENNWARLSLHAGQDAYACPTE